jgi:MYXO-CTERM domain-containing protein
MNLDRAALGLVVLSSTLALAPQALANGRFPRAQRLLEQNADPERLVLAATYGILLTSDRGAEWRHVCELGFAFANAEIDPVVSAFPDGSLVVRGIRSLNRAEAPYCEFEPMLGTEGTDTVADFTVDASDPDRLLGLMMERSERSTTINRLYESLDAGRSFAPFGEPLPEDDVTFGITIDIAPNDPERIYATALGVGATSVFVRSDDAAASFTTVPLSLEPDEYPYIAAVAPDDADTIYVRTDLWKNVDGIYQASDALLVSRDGGATFDEVFRQSAKLLGFALSPDGRDVLVGFGDPVDPSRSVDASALGLYRASTTDFAFTKIYEGSVSCLTWTETGLYVCTAQSERGYSLGFAPSADFALADSDPFTPLLDLRNVAGPVECPSCTTTGACRESWETTCALFGSCASGVGGSSATDATCGGSGGAAGRGGSGGEAARGGAATGGASATSPPGDDDSCGCRVVGGAQDSRAVFALLGYVALFVRRVLRRQSQSLRKREPGMALPGSL